MREIEALAKVITSRKKTLGLTDESLAARMGIPVEELLSRRKNKTVPQTL